MKKSILNIGKALSKIEQKKITGGKAQCCVDVPGCPSFYYATCITFNGQCELYHEYDVTCDDVW